MDAEVFEFGKCLSADAPHIVKGKEREGLASLLVGVYHAHAPVAPVLLGKLAAHLCQRLCRGNAHAHGNVGVEQYLVLQFAHHLHEVEMLLVALQITETLVDAVLFHMAYALSHDADDALAHGGIEHHVCGEHIHLIIFYDVLYLEDGVAPVQS